MVGQAATEDFVGALWGVAGNLAWGWFTGEIQGSTIFGPEGTVIAVSGLITVGAIQGGITGSAYYIVGH